MAKFQAKNLKTGQWEDCTPAKAKAFAEMGLETRELAEQSVSSFDPEIVAQFRVSIRDEFAAKDDPGRIQVAHLSHSDLNKTVAEVLGVSTNSTQNSEQNPNVAALRNWAAANGVEVSSRRLSKESWDAWHAAGAPGKVE